MCPLLLPLPHPIPIGAFMRIHIRFSIEVSKCFNPLLLPSPNPIPIGCTICVSVGRNSLQCPRLEARFKSSCPIGSAWRIRTCRTLLFFCRFIPSSSPRPTSFLLAHLQLSRNIIFEMLCDLCPLLLPLPHPIPVGGFVRIHIRFSIDVSKCFTPSSPYPTPFVLAHSCAFTFVSA